MFILLVETGARHKQTIMASDSDAHSETEVYEYEPSTLYPAGASKSTYVEHYRLPCGKYFVGDVIGLTSSDTGVDMSQYTTDDNERGNGSGSGSGSGNGNGNARDERDERDGSDERDEEEEKTVASVMGWSEDVEKLFTLGSCFQDVVAKTHKGGDVHIMSFQTQDFESVLCEIVENCKVVSTKRVYAGACQFFLISEALLPESFMEKVDPEQKYGYYVEFVPREFEDDEDDTRVNVRVVHQEDSYGLILCESYSTMLRIHWGEKNDKEHPEPFLMPCDSFNCALPASSQVCTSDLFTLFVALEAQLSDVDETPLPEHLSDLLLSYAGADRSNTTAYHVVTAELSRRFLRDQTERDWVDYKKKQRQAERDQAKINAEADGSKKRKLD
jgi:hypothetical protein